MKLRALGFCGADDSCHPELLATISERYPIVEWGVLLRPDLEGTPRYASPAWLEALGKAAARTPSMALAGHLCGARCTDVLAGNVEYVQSLAALGFKRFQVNATAANGVDTSALSPHVAGLRAAMEAAPGVEFIVQCNEETKPLWEALLASPPPNMSLLFDASCGKGVELSVDALPPVHDTVPCGYAGGIGPSNVVEVLTAVSGAAGDTPVWIDMESSLRATRDGADVFSVHKCFTCLQAALPLIADAPPAGK